MKLFWFKSQAFFFIQKILQLRKFDDADFDYDNIVFKLQPKQT